MSPSLPPLPIDPRLAEIAERVREQGSLVLVAEPGAGKTTRTPRALLDAGMAEDGEILVLEPRRLATRMAAQRVAGELNEPVGRRVGYQVRFEDRTSRSTRVRFVTEGILTRRLASQPMLPDVRVVVFDEFHERHLHADLGLAFLHELRRTKRPDLKLLVMSATLEAGPVADLLGAEVLEVEGRPFDVAVEYAERPDDRPLERRVASALRRLVRDGLEGDVLVFLPGAAEIRRGREACEAIAREADLEVAMLHGDMPADEQDRAVRRGTRRKVILSTNVAESSITVEGIVAVIDSGLARVARHSPWSGLPSLETTPISQASAAQRAGRAGRLRPGRCVRLYTRHEHDSRPPQDEPEVRRVDLAEAVLTFRMAGHDLRRLELLDAPPAVALDAAETLLHRIGALGSDGTVTALGRRMASLPLHPRLARLLLESEVRGAAARGCLAAALLGEREIRRGVRTRVADGPARLDEVGRSDLIARIEAFEAAERDGLAAAVIRAHDLDVGAVRATARARNQLARALRCDTISGAPLHEEEESLVVSTLAAFPDRVGRRRNARSDEVVFAGGGSAKLAATSVVKESEFVVALEADERRRGGTTIRIASEVEAEWLLELFPDRVEDRRELRFDQSTEAVEEVVQVLYDGLVLDESRRRDVRSPEVSEVLARAALEAGLERFARGGSLGAFLDRLRFSAAQGLPVQVPGEDELAVVLRELCEGLRSFAELERASILDALRGRIDPALLGRMERFAPTHVSIPGRARVPVSYEPGKPPSIASRLQDFFGATEGPRLAEGRVPLVLHLLAPNRRAVQVTTDLAGFWERHYPALRRTLMRRYPKHAWPEDPVRPSR